MGRQRIWAAAGVICLVCVTVFFLSYFYAQLSHAKGGGLGFSQGKIAVIKIEGTVMDSGPILEEIKQYKDRVDVKAIVLRIDSPGGSVVAAQEIYEELTKLRKQKQILVSMGNVAASGGYYIACAAHKIVANPGTLTGSIGVISEYPNLERLMDKVGWKSLVLKSGQYKDIGNPMREMTKEERQLLQSLIDNIHQQFIRAVAEGRNLDVRTVQPMADGRVFSGEQAKANGLIDQLGNLQDTLEVAGELAGIKGKPVILYPEEKRRIALKRLFKTLSQWISQYLLEEGMEGTHGLVQIQ